jgi:hypothetical protein
VDLDQATIDMVIDCGDLQLGYRRLDLRFVDARIKPDDMQSLEYAVTAEFHPDAWPSVTEIVEAEFAEAPRGRHVLNLRLFPFHAFTIEFGDVSFDEQPLADRGPAEPGEFVTLPRDAPSGRPTRAPSCRYRAEDEHFDS